MHDAYSRVYSNNFHTVTVNVLYLELAVPTCYFVRGNLNSCDEVTQKAKAGYAS